MLVLVISETTLLNPVSITCLLRGQNYHAIVCGSQMLHDLGHSCPFHAHVTWVTESEP